MKSVFLHSKQDFPLNLQKINSSIYYNMQKDTFYRFNIMPSCTTFVSQDVQQNQLMTLTKYDPIFLMITLLLKQKKISSQDIPHYLQKRNWSLVSSEEKTNDKLHYVMDKNKIFDYLERKVTLIEKYLHFQNPLDRLNFVQNQGKFISSDTISLLKNQISPQIVTQFVKQRYNINQSRKFAPQPQQNQALKPKPSNKNKKSTSVAKQIQLPKNQPTLFSSFKKK